MRRIVRAIGTVMVVLGIGALLWASAVWRWEDPFTAGLNYWDQRSLERSFERRLEQSRRGPSAAGAGSDAVPASAAAWRRSSEPGDAIAKLRIPSLGVSEIVVNGTDSDSLKRGPGRYLGSAMPGEGELVYIAGHRTTYGAPFSRIDRLRKGDRVFLQLPYASFEYRITGHRIVPASQISALESNGFEQLVLQACHPRFFASHRYLAYAIPVSVTPVGGERTLAGADG